MIGGPDSAGGPREMLGGPGVMGDFKIAAADLATVRGEIFTKAGKASITRRSNEHTLCVN